MFLLSILLVFLPFVSIGSPVDGLPSGKHPSIDALNTFSKQLSSLTREIIQYKGQNPQLLEQILKDSQTAAKALHTAADAFSNLGNIDGNSITALSAAGISVVSEAHSFCDVMIGKLRIFKAEKNDQLAFAVLDGAYSETRFFIRTMRSKLPTWMMIALRTYHYELLGTISEAREVYRPTQEEVDAGSTPSIPDSPVPNLPVSNSTASNSTILNSPLSKLPISSSPSPTVSTPTTPTTPATVFPMIVVTAVPACLQGGSIILSPKAPEDHT